ncbi:MAG: hypothetical protein M1812_000539 [Candelaria pacifica]|nr:MAG: hypothetical protein M1812_000539 [Candelaria pacifica]
MGYITGSSVQLVHPVREIVGKKHIDNKLYHDVRWAGYEGEEYWQEAFISQEDVTAFEETFDEDMDDMPSTETEDNTQSTHEPPRRSYRAPMKQTVSVKNDQVEFKDIDGQELRAGIHQQSPAGRQVSLSSVHPSSVLLFTLRITAHLQFCIMAAPCCVHPDDFNSSDIEIDNGPPETTSSFDKASIDAIVANAFEDALLRALQPDRSANQEGIKELYEDMPVWASPGRYLNQNMLLGVAAKAGQDITRFHNIYDHSLGEKDNTNPEISMKALGEMLEDEELYDVIE